MTHQLIPIETVSSRPEAELVLTYLRAHGIPCELSQETVGRLEGLPGTPIAKVEILVPYDQRHDAAELIRLHPRGEAEPGD